MTTPAIVLSLCNVPAVYRAFPALSSRSAITSDQILHHIEGAAFEVIGKLAPRYTIPYSQTSGELHYQVSNIVARLAIQGILEERAYMQDRRNESEWPQEFDKVRDLLDEIAEGTIKLVNNDGTIIQPNTNEVKVWSNTSGYNPTFTEDTEVFQDVDTDKIDDIRSDRSL